MAEIKLTKAQQTAVEDRSGTLLVAAGAGSGKTAILTKRLITRLCSPDEEGDISEFVVVTFTKAATGELRTRLYKELSKYVKENPSNKRARRQLSLIGLAKISTIHSFCLDIIKSNFEVLSLPSVLRMGEETEINVLLKSTLDEIIAERYDNSDEGDLFFKALEILSGAKSDENFVQTLLSLYGKLRGLSDYRTKFGIYLENYREIENTEEIFNTAFGRIIRDDLIYETGKIISDFDCLLAEIDMDHEIHAVMHDAIIKDCTAFENIKSAISEGYTETKNAADMFAAARCKPIPKDCSVREKIEELKDHRTKCIQKIRGVFTKYLGASVDTVKCAAKEAREVLEEIFSVICELDDRFSTKKLERGILDFSDLEQYTLKLLVKDTGEISGNFQRTELAKRISDNYREIYIDEYQDTNSVQDMIFRAVAKYDETSGTETNRFLVGDVKQSIYRFRGAQPEIFSSYIKLFSDVTADISKENTTHKLYLSNNFRCSENVINTVNRVFFKVMDGYTADDSLIYSKIEDKKVSAPCELVLLNSIPSEAERESEKFDEEAMYIASRIRDMAYNPNVLNEKGEMYRYSDFAILQRSANSLSDVYRRAFRKMKVPFSCDTPEDFFALPEILLALCLFNCVDNPQRDIYTAGLMYSPIFGFTADEMVEIRQCDRKTSFYSCVEIFAENHIEGTLHQKVTHFLATVRNFRKLSRGTPTDRLISEMFEKTGIYDIYRNNTEKKKNLRKLYEMARSFEKTSFRGLFAFLEYLNDLAEGSSDSRPDAESDSVKFMSIHRSKGLEYPVVFLGGLLREFNTSDEKSPIIFNPSSGIGIKLRDTQDTALTQTKRNFSAINTPFREAIRSTERGLMLEEEKRLLYVAMTRARDRLIMTAVTKKFDRTIQNASVRRDGGFESYGRYAMCYFDFIYHALSDSEFAALQHEEAENCFQNEIKCFKADISEDSFKNIGYTKKADTIPELDETALSGYRELLTEIKSTENYKPILSGISAKISVSQLKKGLLDEEETVRIKPTVKKLPAFMTDEQAPNYAEKGTATHIFMQFADYSSIEKNGAAFEADRLLNLGFMTERMRQIVDLSVIDGFIKSKLYERIKGCPKLYRERRFNLKLPASEFTDSMDNRLSEEFILVQGVCDLYFENPDGTLTLVDFKTDRVSEENGEELLRQRHTSQLGYYKRAVCEITGKTVSSVYVYSFSLSKEVEIFI